MKQIISFTITLAIITLSLYFAASQMSFDSEIEMIESNTLAGLFAFTLDSKNTNRTYVIGVGLPIEYGSIKGKRYPVIFLTDAEGKLHTSLEQVRSLVKGSNIPEVIIVGIFNAAENSRDEDFTPPLVKNTKLKLVAKALIEGPLGGASKFYAFIRDELIPLIDDEFATDTNTRVYFGHSLGGLFGIYSLQQKDDPFTHYLISSPSIWYDDRIILDYKMKTKTEPRTVYLSVGEFEQIPPNLDKDILAYFPQEVIESDKYVRMVDGMLELFDYLDDQENIDVYAHIEEGFSHVSADTPAFLRGIPILLESTNQGELRQRSEGRPTLPWEQ